MGTQNIIQVGKVFPGTMHIAPGAEGVETSDWKYGVLLIFIAFYCRILRLSGRCCVFGE